MPGDAIGDQSVPAVRRAGVESRGIGSSGNQNSRRISHNVERKELVPG